jgi:hypothetical protein
MNQRTSAIGKWFVMMYSQSGAYVMPLVDDDQEVMLWDTEGVANDAARDNNYANAFGFQAYEVGA